MNHGHDESIPAWVRKIKAISQPAIFMFIFMEMKILNFPLSISVAKN